MEVFKVVQNNVPITLNAYSINEAKIHPGAGSGKAYLSHWWDKMKHY